MERSKSANNWHIVSKLVIGIFLFFRNKCITEKKRRELENETINQLEELLGTCLAEVKQPDKNGIVREATRQIQEVLRRRRECPEECPLRVAQCLSPVQAGEVSSTQPSCAGLQYSELTSLIEVKKLNISIWYIVVNKKRTNRIVIVLIFFLKDHTYFTCYNSQYYFLIRCSIM